VASCGIIGFAAMISSTDVLKRAASGQRILISLVIDQFTRDIQPAKWCRQVAPWRDHI
jgi:hypothetical protein